LTVALEPAGEIKLQQDNMHLAGLEPGAPDQLVDIDRTWAERGNDPLALVLADVGKGTGRAFLIRRRKLDFGCPGSPEDWR